MGCSYASLVAHQSLRNRVDLLGSQRPSSPGSICETIVRDGRRPVRRYRQNLFQSANAIQDIQDIRGDCAHQNQGVAPDPTPSLFLSLGETSRQTNNWVLKNSERKAHKGTVRRNETVIGRRALRCFEGWNNCSKINRRKKSTLPCFTDVGDARDRALHQADSTARWVSSISTKTSRPTLKTSIIAFDFYIQRSVLSSAQ